MTLMDDMCRRVFTEVEAYLDGELDVGACRRLEEHAARCPACARDINRLRHTIGMCRDAGRMPLPDAVRDKARAAVRRLLSGRAKEVES